MPFTALRKVHLLVQYPSSACSLGHAMARRLLRVVTIPILVFILWITFGFSPSFSTPHYKSRFVRGQEEERVRSGLEVEESNSNIAGQSNNKSLRKKQVRQKKTKDTEVDFLAEANIQIKSNKKAQNEGEGEFMGLMVDRYWGYFLPLNVQDEGEPAPG